jgi:hypothetical protein
MENQNELIFGDLQSPVLMSCFRLSQPTRHFTDVDARISAGRGDSTVHSLEILFMHRRSFCLGLVPFLTPAAAYSVQPQSYAVASNLAGNGPSATAAVFIEAHQLLNAYGMKPPT